MQIRKGFTMIELMIVILIVAVLAAVAIPMMRGRLEMAKWSEADATAAQIVGDVRSYVEKWSSAPTNSSATVLGYAAAADLNGQYFPGTSYGWTTDYTSVDDYTVVVTITRPAGVTAGPTTRTLTFDKAAGTMTWAP